MLQNFTVLECDTLACDTLKDAEVELFKTDDCLHVTDSHFIVK